MFDFLSDRIGNIFNRLGNKGSLSEKDIDEALRQVRVALLEADVSLKVIKDFTSRVRERCLTSDVLQSLTPAQQVVKIVHDELVTIIGGKQSHLITAGHPPSIMMLVGLQGGGKTTTAAKLGLRLRRSDQRVLLVAADTRRPAAIEQLIVLGKQLDIPVYSEDAKVPEYEICSHAVARAKSMGVDWVIVDTQGRLHIDEGMMNELAQIKRSLNPSEVLLVADAMTGQEAVRVAGEFNDKVGVTGLILTKMDGDARGGAALTMRTVTGVPIKFIGIGERSDALEPFHPDRMASRILGMGDMLTLIEKAEKSFDEKKAKEMEKKMKTSTFDLDDFLDQLQEIKKMGPIGQLVEMIPGLPKHDAQSEVDETQLKRVEAIIRSMTAEERSNPSLIGGSRRRRIARGSGTTPQDVNQLLNQFRQSQKLLKQLDPKKRANPMAMLKNRP